MSNSMPASRIGFKENQDMLLPLQKKTADTGNALADSADAMKTDMDELRTSNSNLQTELRGLRSINVDLNSRMEEMQIIIFDTSSRAEGAEGSLHVLQIENRELESKVERNREQLAHFLKFGEHCRGREGTERDGTHVGISEPSLEGANDAGVLKETMRLLSKNELGRALLTSLNIHVEQPQDVWLNCKLSPLKPELLP